MFTGSTESEAGAGTRLAACRQCGYYIRLALATRYGFGRGFDGRRRFRLYPDQLLDAR